MADNLEEIYCPACGKKMKKIFMPQQNVNLDVCVDGCGGIYFDNREFSQFDEQNEDISPLLDVLDGKVFGSVNENAERKCPVCGNIMVKNFASAKHQIQVDECYNCGGKFLDFGEIDKIRCQYNTEAERSADAIKELYSIAGKEISSLELNYKKIKARHSINKYTPSIVLLLLILLIILLAAMLLKIYF